MAASNAVYSATYSNAGLPSLPIPLEILLRVPVFEFIADTKNGPEYVMRRRQDNWINATHILKVAEQQKASRTRILEREVQKDVHEKIQGGYGKFQGTWVPLQKGKELAERNGVYEKLKPLFEYMAGDKSPPQAPKHTTAASNKIRTLAKPAARPKKVAKPKAVPIFSQMSDDRYGNSSPQQIDDESVENSSVASQSNIDEQDSYQRPQQSRKRKREPDAVDAQDVLYADRLLDYFILSGSDAPMLDLDFPFPPPGYPINRHIDNQNHSALHWAAAMGDIPIVGEFLKLGANIRARNIRGETPVMRAIIFTNNYEKGTMNELVDLLQPTWQDRDDFGGTVFHHAAALTLSLTKKKCARNYLEILLNKLGDSMSQQEFFNFINLKDHKGDTALHIVARNEAKRCIQTLQGRGVASDIPNAKGETVDEILYRLRKRRTDQFTYFSSSPVQPDLLHIKGTELSRMSRSAAIPTGNQYESQSAQSFSESFSGKLPDKALQVALDIEEGVQEKEVDLAESNRLLQNVTSELNQVRRESRTLITNDNGDNEDEDDKQLQKDADALILANQSLIEQHQHKSLHMRVRSEERNLHPSAHHDRTKSNGENPDESELERKIRAARSLAEMQVQRRSFVTTVVQAQATAGMTERGDLYKRLISSSMGIPADEVTAMIPELLDVLEMSKMEVNDEGSGEEIVCH